MSLINDKWKEKGLKSLKVIKLENNLRDMNSGKYFITPIAIVILRLQRFRVLTSIHRVLIRWQSTDCLQFNHKLNILNFLLLASRYRLKDTSHWTKNIYPALWTGESPVHAF